MTDAVQPDARRDRLGHVREVLLWVGAIAGLLCLLLAFVAVAFGIKPIIFTSGSMSPTIDTGDLSLSRTVGGSDLKVGDIVTVRNAKGSRVTHRITTITPNGDSVTLVLKGDANNAVDQNAYQVAEADRVLFSIPKAGYVASALSGRYGTFAAGLLVGLVLVTAFGRKRRDDDETAAALEVVPVEAAPVVLAPARLRRRPALAACIGLAMIGLLVAGTKETGAYWTDAVAVNSGTFTMRVPFLITACTRNTTTGAITVTWPTYSTATSYNVTTTNPNVTTNGVTSPRTVAVGKNTDGTVTITAVTPTGNVASVPWTYDGGGSNQDCHA